MEGTAGLPKSARDERCWRDFNPGHWRNAIDVRDFIVSNVSPYGGDEKFLAGPSKRTQAVWAKLQPYFQEERQKGVLAVDAKTPSTLLAHQAGYIDRDNEVIVGLQTDQPFKRAIFPYGGLRMVEAGLKAAPTAAAASSATIVVSRSTGWTGCSTQSAPNAPRSTTCGRPTR
jgi:formate C-acetyltransferase